MATVLITKKSVLTKQNGLYSITHSMQLLSGEDILFSQEFTKEYRSGDDIAALATSFLADMQAAIDKYKAEQAIFTHAKMDAMITYLNANLLG